MSYDLVAWPVRSPMSVEQAIAQIQDRASRWAIGIGRDERVKAFVAAMDDTFPGVGSMASPIPMEFDVHRDWVHMALPWSMVGELVRAIAPIAFNAGLALYDPQREEVALPPPFGAAPLGVKGIDEREQMAATAMNAIISGLDVPAGMPPMAGIGQSVRDAGFTMQSPLGFTITQDTEAEVVGDPIRVPTSLQTDERKRHLLDALDDAHASRRFAALQMLGGWGPDRDVANALRRLLESEDATTVGLAAAALAHQRDPADLPLLLDHLYRMSPADGASIESMLLPLSASFELARVIGAEATQNVEAKAREWARAPNGSRRQWTISEHDFEEVLEAMKRLPPDIPRRRPNE